MCGGVGCHERDLVGGTRVIGADLFRTTPTSGVPGWLVSPGDLVSTVHGQGRVVTVFEFPIVAVEVGGRVLSFRQDELTG